MITLFTIGFTQKSAQQFFELLRYNGITVLVDTRLKPNSQLSGFARGNDLPYLLRQIVPCDYRHIGEMSPTSEILERYRSDGDWVSYELAFNTLLVQRNLSASLDMKWWASQSACLLCSEHSPEHCHRRLVAEYLRSEWKAVEVNHLM
jgi:uncharacterized protein (DUF488 family)